MHRERPTTVHITMSTNESEALRATEQTPLLRGVDPAHSDQEDGQEPAAEEVSTRELIITLGSIWVGVFLAALGKLHATESCEPPG